MENYRTFAREYYRFHYSWMDDETTQRVHSRMPPGIVDRLADLEVRDTAE